jgi:predicted permease
MAVRLRSGLARLRSFFGGVTKRHKIENDLTDEIAFHLKARTEHWMAQGHSREEAARKARLEFGGLETHKEEWRQARGLRLLDELKNDLTYGVRMLKSSPTFTIVSIAILAIAIGANIAVFNVLDAVALRKLPVNNPDQLREIAWIQRSNHTSQGINYNGSQRPWDGGDRIATSFAYPPYAAVRDRATTLSDVMLYMRYDLTANVNGRDLRVLGLLVSGNFLSGVGVQPLVGRNIEAPDDRAGANPVSVLTYDAWQRLFGGEPAAAIGKVITLNGASTTVIGVLPRSFYGVDPGSPIEIITPITPLIATVDRNPETMTSMRRWGFQLLGRVKPGMDDARVSAEIEMLMRQTLPADFSTGARPMFREVVLKDASQGTDSLRRNYMPQLYLLMAIMGALLLIACANIASLLLARAAAREREMGLRLALGAGRGRLVRQMLTESALLALIGGAAGVLAGMAVASQLLPLLNQDEEPIVITLGWSPWLAAFVIGLSLVVSALCGILPALRASGVGLVPLLKRDVGGRPPSSTRLFAGKTLIVMQVTLSLVLLIGAALFLRTLMNLRSQPLGFNADNLLLFQMDARPNGYSGVRLTDFYEQVLTRVASTPGVRSATVSRHGLLTGGGTSDGLRVPDVPAAQGTPNPERGFQLSVHIHRVPPGYFETMGIRLMGGRDFSAGDRENAPTVMIVNEAFLKALPREWSPLGRRVNHGDTDWEIVGVAADARYRDMREETPPTIYLPFRQVPQSYVTFAARTAGNPGGVAGPVRAAVEQFAPTVPIFRMRTQDDQIDSITRQERLFAYSATGFAGLAMLLACLGLYGTLAYSVARRTMEIGVRMALGADRRSVTRMVLRESLLPVVIGIALGLGVAAYSTRVIQEMLFELEAKDLPSMAMATGALVASALLAAWIPCRRASGVDPMTALRRE